MAEVDEVRGLFGCLIDGRQRPCRFPVKARQLEAPDEHGVYVIIRRCSGTVAHVGRTCRGKTGLRGRLRRHVQGNSSFVKTCLHGNRNVLPRDYEFRYLVVKKARLRALLEYYAIGRLCPRHLGLGI